MDWLLTERLNALLSHHDRWADAVPTYERLAEALFVLVVLTLLVAGGRRLRRAGIAGALSAGLAFAVAQVISHAVDRPRPFVAHGDGVHLLVRHAADAGFPSDHATAAFAIAGGVLAFDRRFGGVLLALSVMLCMGRIALGLHYPSDVLAGAALGSAVAWLVTHGPARHRLERLADRIEDRPAFRVPASVGAPR